MLPYAREIADKLPPLRKSVTDKFIAVRETGVSRHQGGPIEGPPEPPRTSKHYCIVFSVYASRLPPLGQRCTFSQPGVLFADWPAALAPRWDFCHWLGKLYLHFLSYY